MKQHSRDKTGKAFAIGQKAQNDFLDAMQDKGWTVQPASFKQDTKEHWDYLIRKGETALKVDVKAEKRISRSDDSTQAEWIWVEFQNGAGEVGWLYGEADYIAFQREDSFSFIKREKLVEIVENLVKSEYVSKSIDAKYRLYRRFGRNDLLTLINYSDIKDFCIEL